MNQEQLSFTHFVQIEIEWNDDARAEKKKKEEKEVKNNTEVAVSRQYNLTPAFSTPSIWFK